MNSRQWFRASRSVASAIVSIAGASLLLAAAVPAQAQNLTASLPNGLTIGTPLTATVTLTITTAGTLNTISVNGSDYALASGNTGTCSMGVSYTTSPTNTCTVQVTFTPSHPWVRYGGVSLSDSSGNLLGNDFIWGTGAGPQVSYPISTSTAASAIGSGFSSPQGIAVDSAGNVYVADTNHGAIKEFSALGVSVNTWSGFTSPTGVAVDGSGNIYVAASTVVEELIAVGGVVPATPTVVSLGNGTFVSPTGVAVDSSGNVYVTDTANVDELVAVNGVIPSTESPVTLNTPSAFSLAYGVAVDGSGNVYVADKGAGTVDKLVAVSGAVQVPTTPTVLSSSFTSPTSVAVDGSGNVYVADTSKTFIEELPFGSSSIVNLGSSSSFTTPTGVAVDASGDVVVADAGLTTAEELSAQTLPTLGFASTAVGAISSDSPKTVTITNNGNAALTFTALPSVSTNFSLGASSTCLQLASSPSPLAARASCSNSVSFAPTQAGSSLTGSLTIADIAAGSPQSISLSGTGTFGTPSVAATSTSAQVNATSVTLTATITYPGVAPTGAVTFTVNGGSPVTATCVGSSSPRTCTASYNSASLPATVAGYAIVVNEAADANYNVATSSNSATLTIAPAPITLAISAWPSSASVDSTASFTATVSSNATFSPITTASTDAVIFTLNGTTVLCTSPLSVSTQTATCTTSALVAGSNDKVTAAFASSDPNFFSVSAPPSATGSVSAAATATTVSTPGAANVSQNVTLTATVAPAAGLSQTAVLPQTGTISYFDLASTTPTTPICGPTAIVAGAVPSCSHAFTSTGSHIITATYVSTDSNFSGSTSTSASITGNTVNVGNSGVTLSVSPGSGNLAPVSVDQTGDTFLAAIANFPSNVTGTLTYFDNGATISGANCSSVSVPSSGSPASSCAHTFATAGSHSITATFTQTGSSSPLILTSGPVVVNVAQTSLTLAATPPTSPSVGTPATFSATVSLPSTVPNATPTVPTGSITFTPASGTGTSCTTSAVTTSGTSFGASCSLTFSTSGSHIVTVSYGNDPNFSAVNITPSVTVATSSTTLTVNPGGGNLSPVSVDQTGDTFLAAFTNFPSNLTGTLTYSDNGTAIAGTNCSNAAVPTSGVLASSCSYTFASAGSHTITATFTPTGSSSPLQLTTNPAIVTVAQTPLTLKATPPSPSVDIPINFSATVSLPSNISDTATGDSVPSGSITFTPDVGAPCTQALTAPAGCPLTFLTAGAHTVTVSYGSDTNFSATSILENVTVSKTGLTLTAPPPTVSLPAPPLNAPTAFTAVVSLPSSATGSTVASGTITFTPDNNATPSSCSGPVATTGSNIGQASCSLAFSTAGSHTVTVSYSNDNNFTASSVPEIVSVGSATPTVAIVSSLNPSVASQQVTFTATVTSTTGVTPTKLVTFSLPQATLSAATPNPCTLISTAAGTASCSVTVTYPSTAATTASNSTTVTATYGGDSNYTSASAPSLPQIVQNFGLSPTTLAALTISQGNTNQSDTYTSQPIVLTETPVSGFTDPLTVLCPAPAAGVTVTCTLSGTTVASTITAGSSATPGTYTVTYTVSDSKVPALFYTASGSLTVVNQAPTVYVASIGSTAASFTAPSGLTITGCNPKVATQNGSTYTTSTSQTLVGIGIACSTFASTGTNYTFTITAGAQSSARLETEHRGTVLAFLGAPFLLMLGLLPASRKFRKAMLHGLAILALGVLLMHATGCGSGGFTEPQGTHATDGSYLIDIEGTGGSTVAEVPVVVSD